MTKYLLTFEATTEQLAIVALLQSKGFSPLVKVLEEMVLPEPTRTSEPRNALIKISPPKTPEERWQGLLKSVGSSSKAIVLGLIAKHPKGISTEGAAEILEWEVKTFIGVLNGGLRRNIKSAGYAFGDLILMKPDFKGVNTFYPGPILVEHTLKD